MALWQALAHVWLQMGWPVWPQAPIWRQYVSLMEASNQLRTWQYRLAAGQWGSPGLPGQHGPPSAVHPHQ